MSTRTAVSLVHVPMMESAALPPAANTRVPVLLVTKVLAASMTQMNVKTRLPCAGTQAGVSTPTAPTSVYALLGLRVDIVKARTPLAHLHRA